MEPTTGATTAPTHDPASRARPGRRWQRVDGVVLLDKPAGMTSNAALQAVRRLYAAAKGGHTGTLDPLATGLLPLCLGEATKFSADLLEAPKTYEADILFGVTTSTGDAEGEMLARRPVEFSLQELAGTLPAFRGRIRQVPPMYSALKRNGQPLYELARRGVTVERAAREVTIHALELLEFSGERCRLRVACSKGTYIRTLVEDIGQALACGAHLTALRRIAVGDLTLAAAVPLARLETGGEAVRRESLLPVDTLLQSLMPVALDALAARRFLHGNPVVLSVARRAGTIVETGRCRVYHGSHLLGVGALDLCGQLKPVRVLSAE